MYILSIPFMGYGVDELYYLIRINFQFPLWDTQGKIIVVVVLPCHFQFPLWDTILLTYPPYQVILHFQFPLWDT